ncbi:hypothetical protein B484DRAFT_389013 [Ochromonadaceae sp. CCMP2298]|nr:hypothetical protein B484DRAFT_389013 [Ochromonadaceae sp. CCMP2298]
MEEMAADNKLTADEMAADNKLTADEMAADNKLTAEEMAADNKLTAEIMAADDKLMWEKMDDKYFVTTGIELFGAVTSVGTLYINPDLRPTLEKLGEVNKKEDKP